MRDPGPVRLGARPPSLLATAAGGVRDALARPGAVIAFLVLNLGVAVALAAPLASVLEADLDRSLYGETMADGASWRWFDTADRRHPALLGDLSAWNALFDDEELGVDGGDLAKLAGVPLAVALAGLGLYWLNALLHTGWLVALSSQAEAPSLAPGLGSPLAPGSGSAMLAGAATFALPTTVIAAVAAAGYAAAYSLCHTGLGRLFDGVGAAAQREWVSLGLTWLEVVVTLGALLAVKLWSDLAKASLAGRGTARPLAALPGAMAAALGELLRRGPRYVLVYLAIGLGTPVLAALWWVVALLLDPATAWPALALLVLAQQLLLGARITLRLAHLAATRRLLAGI